MATSIVPELSTQAKRRAERAIENVHIAYYQKGGLRDTEDKLLKQRQSVAGELFALARYASEHCKTREQAITLFGEMCKHAEARYKDEHEVDNLREALPTWGTLKSNILRGVRDYELDPVEYRSEGAFRIEMQKRQQTALPAPREPADEDELDRVLEATVPFDNVRILTARLVSECSALKRSAANKAERVLQEALAELAPLIDQRKVQS